MPTMPSIRRLSESAAGAAFGAALAAVLAPAALAQQAAQAPGGEEARGGAIEEIIVTATRRADNLQNVAGAITAFGAQAIERDRIYGLEDVASRTPGFLIGQQSPAAPELTIRGIGSDDREAGSDRSVVLFVDEVYIGRAGGSALDFFDLERIEVLRGPQGTLWGRNVVGGAVNLVTRKPGPDPYARLSIGAGNYDLLEGRGVINRPLGGDLAAKLSFSFRDRDGYSRNTVFDEDVDGGNNASLRGQLRYGGERLTALFTADYNTEQVDGISSKPDPVGGAFNVTGRGSQLLPDIRLVGNNIVGELDRHIYGATLRLDYETSAAVWTSLTSFRRVAFEVQRDIAGATLSGGNPGQNLGFASIALNDEASNTFSQELRVSSPSDAGAWEWTVGVFYLFEDIERDQIRDRNLTRTRPSAITINGVSHPTPAGECDLGMTHPTNPQPAWLPVDGSCRTVSRPLFDQAIEATSYAAFAQATWAAAERFRITLGGRYTSDSKDFDLEVSSTRERLPRGDANFGDPAALNAVNSLNPAGEEFTLSVDDSWSAFTPKLTLDYQLAENVLAYVTASRGYKSGGFNGLGPSEEEARKSFDPEYAWNYEIGVKSQFFADRLRFNLAGFRMDFEDLQLRRRILRVPGDDASAVVIVFNAAEAEIIGAELEMVFAPSPNLILSGSYSFLDTEATRFTDIADDRFTGTQLPRAPESAFTLAAEYSIPLRAGELSLRGEYRQRGDHWFGIGELTHRSGVRAGFEEAYGIFDASLTYTPNGEGLGFAIWAKNLTDEEYRSHVQPISSGAGGITRYGDPATWGATLTWSY